MQRSIGHMVLETLPRERTYCAVVYLVTIVNNNAYVKLVVSKTSVGTDRTDNLHDVN